MEEQSNFSRLMHAHLKLIGKSLYWLNKQYSPKKQTSYIYDLISSNGRPGDKVLKRLSEIPELGLDVGTLKLWRAMDELSQKERETLIFEYFNELDPEDALGVFKRNYPPEKLAKMMEAAWAEIEKAEVK